MQEADLNTGVSYGVVTTLITDWMHKKAGFIRIGCYIDEALRVSIKQASFILKEYKQGVVLKNRWWWALG